MSLRACAWRLGSPRCSSTRKPPWRHSLQSPAGRSLLVCVSTTRCTPSVPVSIVVTAPIPFRVAAMYRGRWVRRSAWVHVNATLRLLLASTAPVAHAQRVILRRDHAVEMQKIGQPGKESSTSVPTFFLKPTSAYITEGSAIEIPDFAGDEIHHEVELGVVIGKAGRDIVDHEAHISGYVLALDMTARKLQLEAKAKGLPWTEGKGCDTFCPISNFIPKTKINDAHDVDLWLDVDGERRQEGNTRDMIFSIPEIIRHVSTRMTLNEGDIILTGTPSGVGGVRPGQEITAGLVSNGTEIVRMKFPVVRRETPRFYRDAEAPSPAPSQ